jgi:hypothetical protein
MTSRLQLTEGLYRDRHNLPETSSTSPVGFTYVMRFRFFSRLTDYNKQTSAGGYPECVLCNERMACDVGAGCGHINGNIPCSKRFWTKPCVTCRKDFTPIRKFL